MKTALLDYARTVIPAAVVDAFATKVAAGDSTALRDLSRYRDEVWQTLDIEADWRGPTTPAGTRLAVLDLLADAGRYDLMPGAYRTSQVDAAQAARLAAEYAYDVGKMLARGRVPGLPAECHSLTA